MELNREQTRAGLCLILMDTQETMLDPWNWCGLRLIILPAPVVGSKAATKRLAGSPPPKLGFGGTRSY